MLFHGRLTPFLAAAVSCLWLTACGGGFDQGAGTTTIFCDTMYDDGPSVSLTCVDCSVENPEYASDDSAHSFATVRILTSAETQGAAIRSSLPFFVGESAGSHAGAFLTLPQNTGGTLASLAVRIRTYSQGAVAQEESAQTGADLDVLEGSLTSEEVPGGDASLPRTYVYFVPTRSFDAMEVSVSATGLHDDGGYTETRIYGLCSNGGIRH